MLVLSIPLVWSGCTASQRSSTPRITLFSAVALKPPLEELRRHYQVRTGIEVEVTYGASGALLSQMVLAQRGDLYIAASQDFMDYAEREGAVVPATRQVLAYLVPAILVAKGNPKGIQGLSDLARPGIRVGIGNPQAVAAGALALEILEQSGMKQAIEERVVTQTRNVEELAAILALGQIDAALGWDVMAAWAPEKIEVVHLPPQQVPRLGHVPVAVSAYSRNREAAEGFISLLTSAEGKAILKRYGYMVDREDALRYGPVP